jgi:hypothetical protein
MQAITPLPYNPFEKPIADETERTIKRHYDDKYSEFLKSAETRIAFQLSLRYFLDCNPTLGSLVKNLTGNELVILDSNEVDNPIHYLFVGNCIPHINVTIENFASVALNPRQTLILTTDVKTEQVHVDKIKKFVESGGVVLSFNKAINITTQLVSGVYPNIISFKNGQSTLDKKIEVQVLDTGDSSIFLGLQNFSEKKKATRFAGVRRFQVNEENSNVTVLVKETSPSEYPIAAKISYGRGFIFHFIYVGTDEILDFKSKEKAQFFCKQVEEGPNIDQFTKNAWKTALLCSQWGSFYLAISLLPFFDIVSEL